MVHTRTQNNPDAPTFTTINFDDFKGLREQIHANAAVLYPQVLSNSRAYQTTGFVMPSQVFEVIIIGAQHMQAVLVYGEFPVKRVAATGPAAGTAEAALQALLEVTSEALSWYTESLLGQVQNAEWCLNGRVDLKMVEAGFHYAAAQRWALDNQYN